MEKENQVVAHEAEKQVVVEEDEEEDWSSDSDIGDALDYLDSKDDDAVEGAFTINSRRPNAHGGLHSRPNSSTLQPLSNRNERFSTHIRASPLEVKIFILLLYNYQKLRTLVVKKKFTFGWVCGVGMGRQACWHVQLCHNCH